MNSLVVLTRPGDKNQQLAARLGAGAIHTLVLPALEIRPLVHDPAQLPQPDAYDLIIFVSGNAARLYLELYSRHDPAQRWPAHTHVATVGAASAQPLYNAGFIDHAQVVSPAADAVLQDSEALWALLRPLAGQFKRVLIVRGQTGRDWLGEQLKHAGAVVQRLAVYAREPAAWPVQARGLLKASLDCGRPVVCLLTSVESIEAMRRQTHEHDLDALWRQASFVAIHERIAQRVLALLSSTSGKVCRPTIALCAPNDDAIFQAIESIVSP